MMELKKNYILPQMREDWDVESEHAYAELQLPIEDTRVSEPQASQTLVCDDVTEAFNAYSDDVVVKF